MNQFPSPDSSWEIEFWGEYPMASSFLGFIQNIPVVKGCTLWKDCILKRRYCTQLSPAASPTLPRVTKPLLMYSDDLLSCLPSTGQREEGRSSLESTGQSHAQGTDPAWSGEACRHVEGGSRVNTGYCAWCLGTRATPGSFQTLFQISPEGSQVESDHNGDMCICVSWGFPGGANGKEPTCWCRRHKRCGFWSLGWKDRSPGEGNGNPLQYSCLENPIDRGAWQGTVHIEKKIYIYIFTGKVQSILSIWIM